ncbi:hypothetical protein BDQ17DRAFT_1500125 [Cyathus striatus]|nr:hypothetical protein BDQ17DRAFT_1500125 [Cyathus striatus]
MRTNLYVFCASTYLFWYQSKLTLSNLEALCKDLGAHVLFLPKFHCELNFIGQC